MARIKKTKTGHVFNCAYIFKTGIEQSLQNLLFAPQQILNFSLYITDAAKKVQDYDLYGCDQL
jgi:hypothetical protein